MPRTGRQHAVTLTSEKETGFENMPDDLPVGFQNPNDPNNNQALTAHSPLALAASRMNEDKELENFAKAAERESAEISKLDKAIEEFPDSDDTDAFVDIYRHPAEGGDPRWLHRASMSEWRGMRQPWLARTFGQGKYEIYMYRGGGRGLYSRPKCTIDRDGAELQKKLWQRDHPDEVPAAPAAPAPSVGGGGTERLAQVMIQGFTELGKMIAAQKNSGDGDEEKFLRKMAMYKELFAPAPTAQPALAGAGSTLDTAIKIAGLIHPGAVEKSTLETFAEIAKEFAPGIIEAVKQAAPQIPQQKALSAPSPRPTNPEQDMNVIQNTIIRAQLKNLIARAEKDSDPALYAEVIFDNLENIPGEFVSRFLQDPNWMQWLASFDKRVMNHVEWFAELYAELKRVIEEEAQNTTRENLTPPSQAGKTSAINFPGDTDVFNGSPGSETGELS